eukprot:scaffold48270_cov69-Phaeocystis_antarctica.AAC.1
MTTGCTQRGGSPRQRSHATAASSTRAECGSGETSERPTAATPTQMTEAGALGTGALGASSAACVASCVAWPSSSAKSVCFPAYRTRRPPQAETTTVASVPVPCAGRPDLAQTSPSSVHAAHFDSMARACASTRAAAESVALVTTIVLIVPGEIPSASASSKPSMSASAPAARELEIPAVTITSTKTPSAVRLAVRKVFIDAAVSKPC